MLKQTIIWTALPNGINGKLVEGSTLRLSALVAPRLWNTDPSIKSMLLASFPDFLDFPTSAAGMSFTVDFDGMTVPATPVFTEPLRSDLWKALFKPETIVYPFEFDDYSDRRIDSFDTVAIHTFLVDLYRRVGTDPSYGAGVNKPDVDVLGRDSGINEIAKPVTPFQPYVPPRVPDNPVVLKPPRDTDPRPDAKQVGCWLVVILALIALLRWVFSRLASIFLRAFPTSANPAAGGDDTFNASAASSVKASVQNLHGMIDPPKVSAVMPTPDDLKEQYDFHQMISALGDYPYLLRLLGLVVDLEVAFDPTMLSPNCAVRVMATWLPQTADTFQFSPKTHARLEDDRFIAAPRPDTTHGTWTYKSDMSDGYLRLSDPNSFLVIQEDVVGAALKLENTATNVVAHVTGITPIENEPEDSSLPSLRTAGLSLVKPKLADWLHQQFMFAASYNTFLVGLGGAPNVTPPAPPAELSLAPSDDLYSDDLVRGYRLDFWDDQSKLWRSLHERIGTFVFLDAEGGAITITNSDLSEGFVQNSVTERLDEPNPALQAHESLITWNGWSLSAPRPGQTLSTADKNAPAYIKSTAATNFRLETAFMAKPKSLPRLRFGYKYRLRARVVDLAGNSVIRPGDPAFALDVPEITSEIEFRRFEPLNPPAIVLRTEPVEGESLERMVLRSQMDTDAAALLALTNERHVVPPKAPQLLAEYHGKFDNSPGSMKRDSLGYDLASLEAGTATERMNLATGKLEPIPGAKQIDALNPDGSKAHTFWLQENADFELAYLPDPIARGVLLLIYNALDTVDSADHIRVPFEGVFPTVKPFRLRVVGIPADAPTAAPDWDNLTHLLTIQLAQSEVYKLRISCYMDAADVNRQGVWDWSSNPAPANLPVLQNNAVAGRNWLLMPYREMMLVHAVLQPLRIPAFPANGLTPLKALGETAITLNGTVVLHGKSTGKIDVTARWTDPFDNVRKPKFDSAVDFVEHRNHICELQVTDPNALDSTLTAIVQNFGDTKYHQVTYTPTATTRFREYFPLLVTANLENIIRPTQAEITSDMPKDGVSLKPSEAEITVDVLNSARPDAPKVLYVIPTFEWQETPAQNIPGGKRFTRTRVGNGLRIYLDRPWYSSGAGELLGVVFLNKLPIQQISKNLRNYVTQWGSDPLFDALKGVDEEPSAGNFIGGKIHHDLTLEEFPAQLVSIAAYPVEYDTTRDLWYCDLEMNVGTVYFPFVRLALVRYQPKSVDGAHISRVVRADLAQLVPDRTATIELQTTGAKVGVDVQITGVTFTVSDTTRFGMEDRQFELDVEQRSATLPSDLEWMPLALPVDIQPPTLPDAFWHGVVMLEKPIPNGQFRLVIRESEIFISDLFPSDKGTTKEHRLVYADQWEIEI